MKSPRQGKPTQGSKSLQTQLNMYALAAKAAGVGALAVAPVAQAKVVYTPTNQVIQRNGVYNLDVNGDGTVDFLIQQWNYGLWASDNQLLADPAVGNGVLGNRSAAAALNSGASIGPNQSFIAGGQNGENMIDVTHTTTGGPSFVGGAWANVRNKYLGLKFQIAGETHYGWARLTVTREFFHFTAILTGYAYETTPNQAIKAGQTSGDEANSSPGFGQLQQRLKAVALSDGAINAAGYKTLGELALGAQSAPIRRQP
jgi:hypothetical protein